MLQNSVGVKELEDKFFWLSANLGLITKLIDVKPEFCYNSS